MKKIFAGLFVLAMVACGSSSPTQSADCKKYVSCYDKATTTTSLDSTYGASGTCWTTTQTYADTCTSACTAALPGLKTSYPNVTECQ